MVVPLDILESASGREMTVTVTVSGFCGSRLTVHLCLDGQPPRDRATNIRRLYDAPASFPWAGLLTETRITGNHRRSGQGSFRVGDPGFG